MSSNNAAKTPDSDSSPSDTGSGSGQPSAEPGRGILLRFRVTIVFVIASLLATSITTFVVVSTTRELATDNFMTEMEFDAVTNINHLIHMVRDNALGFRTFDDAGKLIPHDEQETGEEFDNNPLALSDLAAPDALPALIMWMQEDLEFTNAYIYDLDGTLMWGTTPMRYDITLQMGSSFLLAAAGVADSELEIETKMAGTDQENDEYISEVYLPLRWHSDGPVIGVAELYTDVTYRYSNLVTDRVNEARRTTLIAIGSLVVVLAGFVVTADIFRSRVHQRELAQEQALAVASRTIANELRSRITVLDAAADMIVITDPDGKIQYANKAFTNMTGYSAEEAVGQSPRILNSGQQTPEFFQRMWNDIKSGRVWSGTLVNRRKDGTEYPEDMTITPVLGEDGEILRFIAIKRDISERLKVEAERDAARDLEAEHHELLRVNEVRKEFLTTVSHELRTPLTSMLAFSDVLRHNRDHNLTERQLSQLQLISNGGRQLNELIGDLLDVSRTETGRFELEIARFDIQETIEDVARSIKSVFDHRGQTLKLTNLSESTWMNGDRSRVMQVLNNLLTNSAKYSPNDTLVEMHVSTEQEILQVTVRDHGIGISAEDQHQLFIPFFRVANEETRKESGTGLGLSIVKTIVEMHEGQIELESEPGKGTTVRIRLPGLYAGSLPAGY